VKVVKLVVKVVKAKILAIYAKRDIIFKIILLAF
jgi:hypothetical protein